MKKEFKENLSSYFNDGIGMHGEVELIDLNNGKVLFKKHNMIVQDGRNFIKELFIRQLLSLNRSGESQTNITNALKMGDNIRLESIKFGVNSQATTLEMRELQEPEAALSFSLLDEHVEEKFNVVGTNSGNVSDGIVINYQIKVKMNFNDSMSSSYTLGELGLFYKDPRDSTEYMFSRVAFDPIVIGPGSSLQLTYYIYF